MQLLTIFVFVFIFLCGCAKPHYVNDLASNNQGINGECGLYLSSENLCLTMKWEIFPSESTLGSMTLTFFDKDNPTQAISPKNNLDIVLWMSSMGHGSSPVTVTKREEGIYLATEIFFIMPGPWEIRYQLKDENNQVVDEVIQNIII